MLVGVIEMRIQVVAVCLLTALTLAACSGQTVAATANGQASHGHDTSAASAVGNLVASSSAGAESSVTRPPSAAQQARLPSTVADNDVPTTTPPFRWQTWDPTANSEIEIPQIDDASLRYQDCAIDKAVGSVNPGLRINLDLAAAIDAETPVAVSITNTGNTTVKGHSWYRLYAFQGTTIVGYSPDLSLPFNSLRQNFPRALFQSPDHSIPPGTTVQLPTALLSLASCSGARSNMPSGDYSVIMVETFSIAAPALMTSTSTPHELTAWTWTNVQSASRRFDIHYMS